ncbi:MAG TPA: tetratricopeptide repeat protein [Bacteroidia bacterium]|nr:tetratricopeptide repeat protein [Bacteroidia bacterium]
MKQVVDSAVVNHTLDIGREYVRKGQFYEATSYIKFGRQQARQIGYSAGISRSYNMEANMLCRKGKYLEALERVDSALAVAQRVSDSSTQALSYMVLGNIQCYMGKYAKGMESYFKGLSIEEKSENQIYIHWFFSNIGNLYYDQKNYPKAMEYSYKAIKAEQKAGDKQALLNTYSNLGQIYSSIEKNDSALHYYNLALKLSEETNDGFGIATGLVNMAILYTKMKRYDKAKEYSMKSYKITKQKGFTDLYIYTLTNLGNINKAFGNYTEAEKYFKEAAENAKKMRSTILMKESFLLLASLYDEQKEYEKAYTYFKLYSETKDSLLNQENSKLITEMNTKYTTEKKEKEIELLKKNEEIQKLELVKRKNELDNQRTISISAFAGFLLLMIVALLMYSRYRLKKKANTELQQAFNLIEEKNTLIEKSNLMITDSIVYAKRIQDAILPAKEELSKMLSNDFFIFYKPTQIVSGDFYWCSSQNNKIIFVVADCTGHGVPGAFMSMIGNTLLNEIVNEQKITSTKEIAELLDKKIIHALHQHSDSDQYDGMDISICCIDKLHKEISFTGAHHSMYVCNEQVEKIKGDPFSIGGAQQQNMKLYSSRKIKYKENQKLYFLTDGYCDQSGGPDNKRFGSVKFEKILQEIQTLSMNEQKKLLENNFNEWKKNISQRDDVLVVGIKC